MDLAILKIIDGMLECYVAKEPCTHNWERHKKSCNNTIKFPTINYHVDTCYVVGDILMSFNWQFSEFPGVVCQVLNLPNKPDWFYAAVTECDDNNDNGLYKSTDGCKTWVKIYGGFHARVLYLHTIRNDLFIGGFDPVTEKHQLLWFLNADYNLSKDPYQTITLPNQDFHQIMSMDGQKQNAFSTSLYIAQYDGLSYTENYIETPIKWITLDPEKDEVPDGIVKIRMVTNNQLELSCNNSFSVSSTLVNGAKPTFTICLLPGIKPPIGDILSIFDSCLLNGFTYVSASCRSGPSAQYILLSSSNIPENPNWKLEYENEDQSPLSNNTGLATWNNTIFMRTPDNLSWYTPGSDSETGNTVIPEYHDLAGPARPFITNDTIYLCCDNGIAYSKIDLTN